MADIFQEVDEEVRKDQATLLWEKYGMFVIGGAISVIVAVAAWNFWTSYQQSQQKARAAAYMEAVEAAPENRLSALDGIAGESGYGLLAAFRAADELVATDAAAAAGRFDAIAGDQSASKPLRDLANVKSALISLNEGEFDAALEKVQPLLGPENPYRHTAREIAALSALGSDDTEQAALYARALIDDLSTPRSLRERATVLLDILGIDETN